VRADDFVDSFRHFDAGVHWSRHRRCIIVDKSKPRLEIASKAAAVHRFDVLDFSFSGLPCSADSFVQHSGMISL
jgi:hypothetical protein